MLRRIFRSFLLSLNIKGTGNKVVNIVNGVEKNLILKSKKSIIDITGDNNEIIFLSDEPIKKYPSGLKIKIKGSNNLVIIQLPIRFSNVTIGMDSNNTFKIGSQKQSVANAKFFVEEGADITIGQNCQLNNGNLYVVVNNGGKNRPRLDIGNGVYIAKDCLIRTSDGHSIIDPVSGYAINAPENVTIEDNVWITSRCTILKGSYISEGSIVAAGSIVTRKFLEKNIVIGGVPAKIIKKNIKWDPEHYGKYNAWRGIASADN